MSRSILTAVMVDNPGADAWELVQNECPSDFGFTDEHHMECADCWLRPEDGNREPDGFERVNGSDGKVYVVFGGKE